MDSCSAANFGLQNPRKLFPKDLKYEIYPKEYGSCLKRMLNLGARIVRSQIFFQRFSSKTITINEAIAPNTAEIIAHSPMESL